MTVRLAVESVFGFVWNQCSAWRAARSEESREALKLALVAIAPDITVSAQAVAAEAEAAVEAGEEEALGGGESEAAEGTQVGAAGV